jgi:acetamidase/formamidase
VTEHLLDPESVHHVWDNSLPPALQIRSGDVVHFQTKDGSDGQVRPGCPAEDLRRLDASRFYPLAGPVRVEEAMPGDVLEVEVLAMEPGAWGWCGIIPGLGLLAGDFERPYLRHFQLEGRACAALTDRVHVPIRPFAGTMGVAPHAPGRHPVMPPRRGGGNIDTRHLTVGARLSLPVEVPGAMFSVGDTHAAQGDGEVCGNAIECPMRFSLRFTVRDGAGPRDADYWFATAPGAAEADSGRRGGWFATAAVGPDLLENSRRAVRAMIAWLCHEHGLSREDAYVLCSLAADLRVSQVVDEPNLSVAAHLPLEVFDHCDLALEP